MTITVEAASAPCASCGYEWLRLPFFAVSGASGVGKSTASMFLPRLLPECVRLDGDVLWRQEYYGSETATADYYGTWLRLAIEVAQSGRPLVFAGAVVPMSWEEVDVRPYITEIHYLALVCDPDVHEARLRGRGADPSKDAYFEPSLEFNRWLVGNAASTTPPMSVLDTTALDPRETAEAIAVWVRSR